MFKKIMVAVDLRHEDHLNKSLEIAADLSKQYAAPICYVGVVGSGTSAISHNPEEYEQKLNEFTGRQVEARGVKADCRVYVGHDLPTDVDDILLSAVNDVGADLVVMASHSPTLADYFWPSNGGKIASHSDASVFVVR